MLTLGETAADAAERSFVALFIPLFDPESGADRLGVLTHGLALVVIRLLRAQDPFVVTIPTVHGLVGRGESFVTGRRAHVLDLVQTGHLLLVEFRRIRRENLLQCHKIVHANV